MRHIALTGNNDIAVAKVAQMLVDASRTAGLGLTVHIGVNDARLASTIRIEQPHSELWRVGLDCGRGKKLSAADAKQGIAEAMQQSDDQPDEE